MEQEQYLHLLEQLQDIRARLERNTLINSVRARGAMIYTAQGYAYGRTSEDAAFIILYPGNMKLKHKLCRVYEEMFPKLPPFIDTNIPATAQQGNPDREKAQRQGIYTDTEPFEIAIADGRETQMGNEKRFVTTIPPLAWFQNKYADTITPDEIESQPQPPFKYADGTPVANHHLPQSSFLAYYYVTNHIPKSADELKEWYKANQDQLQSNEIQQV